MRTISVTASVAALAAALLLTSCDDAGDAKNTQDKADTAAGAGCAAELAVRFGPANAAPAAGDTGNVPVTVTNRGDAPCTVEGLPGMELVAGDTTAAVPAAEAASDGKATFAKAPRWPSPSPTSVARRAPRRPSRHGRRRSGCPAPRRRTASSGRTATSP